MEGAIPKFTATDLESDLKLNERGAADGAKNIPASEDNRLSAVEAMIVSRT